MAGRVHDRLRPILSDDNIFLDVTAITPGADFRKSIENALTQCDVVLVFIGPRWMEDDRLADENDFVRQETAIALAKDVPIVPVLVDGAEMPKPEALPSDMRELHFKQAVPLAHATFDRDMALLAERVLGRPSATPQAERPRPFALAVSMAAGAAAMLAVLLVIAIVHNELTGRALSATIGRATTVALILAFGIGGAWLGRQVFKRRDVVDKA